MTYLAFRFAQHNYIDCEDPHCLPIYEFARDRMVKCQSLSGVEHSISLGRMVCVDTL